MPAVDLKKRYAEDGYVIIPGLIEGEYRSNLESACERVIAKTRNGSWLHRRTVGKQFPPYGQDNPDSWGIQHLMHPDLKEPIFVQWYTSPKLLGVATELLGCSEEDLQMELLNLLINPESHDFALRWHRDDIREDATAEEELKALNIWHYGVPRTEAQRKLSSGQIPENPLDMPGAIQITLQPGETVFYNSNILHCATYKSDTRRATLHGCMGDAKGGASRARNILQHGLRWMKGEDFFQTLPNSNANRMLEKLISLSDSSEQRGAVEYSLQN
ncbi:hypothetical protein JR316_0012323 [Psilocybe cubensis]|uniref:Phytanoyl-CoA dioxygenase family protein n=2 Tax=Psilocybe cubensis TaxID=181762 RepID=A0A8H8CFK1_PSICU|nr:hypothetical protein JR316_0012323 [Psilocybe cubensis]KAH9475212.1 hypothetical protein JR316_0012323 [Psilocybe cubensis]